MNSTMDHPFQISLRAVSDKRERQLHSPPRVGSIARWLNSEFEHANGDSGRLRERKYQAGQRIFSSSSITPGCGPIAIRVFSCDARRSLSPEQKTDPRASHEKTPNSNWLLRFRD